MNRPVPADERAMLARTRPNAFDQLRDTGRLGLGMWTEPVEIKAASARRWAAGEALRRLHDAGWHNPCRGAPNPLDGADAAEARRNLASLAEIVGEASWRVVVRVVIAGDSLRECHDLLPGSKIGVLRWCDDVLLDRLSLALDRIGPMLSTEET